MADLVGSMRSDVARSKSLGETESERTATALRVRQMAHQIVLEALALDDDEEEDYDVDDDDDEEEDGDDDENVVVEVNNKEDDWWQRLKKLQIEYGPELAARDKEAKERILDYDPKQGGAYYTRLIQVYDLASFDHDEESPIPPMRFTDVVYKNKNDYELCEAVNIFTVKMGSLDIGFPIHVYGTVIARDSLDKKCVYLFRRDREDSQTINSKDESLILTGPKRGIALISDTYVETNLKIKGDELQQDRELSKGILTIGGIARRLLKNCELESCSLATRLSTVDVVYAVVKDAVEATISVEVLAGEYFGEISACTSSIKNRLVLHDSRLTHSDSGQNIAPAVIPLLRSVVAVYIKEMLLLTIATHTDDGEITKCIEFTPRVNGSDLDEITIGAATLSVRVVWSIINF
ncbi:hypothetical protein BDA96_09G012000 [Sorghum bicolor]|uniref:DUF6598 domain-containing protein n=3 Tax=Sorghum bicolor TaxID=4558 RepID=A0A921Q7N7_SORBI|nr:hypothetical protein BDA96_09G012000 [Sorghum bicolor]KXG21084.1 hypothetical protein SORBI_3009G012000 [Sorghum bicolor]